MGRRDRVGTFEAGAARSTARGKAATEAASLGSAREYWTGILIGYLAAVLTSVGLMLAFLRHGW